jgi:hypothetical protein
MSGGGPLRKEVEMPPQSKEPRMPNAVIALDQARIRAEDDVQYWMHERESRERIVAERQRQLDEAVASFEDCQRKVKEFEAAIALVEGR